MNKVSVIIITYNRPLTVLKRAILSVLNQDYSNFELFVVNDLPENEYLSLQIKNMIDEFSDNRVKYLSYDKNHGSNYARNYGMLHSTGEYIAFLDDDDEWLSTKLRKQVELMEKDAKLALVACGFYLVKDDKIVGEKPAFNKRNKSISYLLESNYIGGTSFPLLRRNAVLEVGGFDNEMVSCQEYDLWIRLRCDYNFASVEEPLGKYYISGDSVYKKSQKRYYLGDKRIIEKYHDLFERYKKSFNIHLNLMSYNFRVAKAFDYSKEYRRMAVKIRPFSLANCPLLYKAIMKIMD